ncbi:MAG: phosphoribosylformylglycinamidine synthase, partial [Lachnospiraceae bacterium]
RNPTVTEIRVLDTYWSDHCRHTTFSTELKKVSFTEGTFRAPIEATYQQYLSDREVLYKDRDDKFVCLMDLALLGMKKLRAEGRLEDLEVSEEINACSIVVPVAIDGETEEWLINFKNETHNHPTEIEPFGGAATCLGGAIRDPLSGRTYVYQAMRITGAADPTRPLSETLKGKLPQRKLVNGAADGYSSYGNQIGLATGYVKELYHPDYAAKRMEIGAVMGAAPRKYVIRETSDPGDIIILLGGRTGRDGIGGATGSSKVHTEESIEVCGAEVQKGNAPTERKIQRLFCRPEVSLLIKKCNDFGAGGVSVAIGELAAGLTIDLDKVPKKYAGLDGTEIAISESQERMAVVVDPKDVDAFLSFAGEENLEAVPVAVVTKQPRLVMNWRGKTIVDVNRAFLDTNGAHQEAEVVLEVPQQEGNPFTRAEVEDRKAAWLKVLSDLNVCSQRGLVEMFDGSIGAGSVFMPYGGKYQLTETQSMVAKLPVRTGNTDTVTMMSYGFDPYLSSWSPYHGAVYAVVSSVAKIVAGGGDYSRIRFTFQEYFKRMTQDPTRWGAPFAALLGAYNAQLGFGLPSIGGKDSMSGTFNDEEHGEINVPPTLVSFAVDVASHQHIISPELKQPGNKLVVFQIERDAYDLPIYSQMTAGYAKLHDDIKNGKIVSAYAIEGHGLAEAVSKMAFGNKLGIKIEHNLDERDFFAAGWGGIVCEVPGDQIGALSISYTLIGEVTDRKELEYGPVSISIDDALDCWISPLEHVFPTESGVKQEEVSDSLYQASSVYICQHKLARPNVFIPVFPGTNCEYDSTRAFERAGANVVTRVFKNLTAADIRDSVDLYKKELANAQIVMFPGGFSAGDEPEGSAKFFATVFRNEIIKEEIDKLLNQRDGLMLGICNGFQALIKLGLVPDGSITEQKADSPTLAMNTIGRHISRMVYTKVVSNKSPWLQKAELGGVYCNPASHGEGRFVANTEWLQNLLEQGQIATQYVDDQGRPTMNEFWNPNGSYMAIEGITSPDGRILGKMAHSERRGEAVAVNIYGEQDMKIFEAGVEYFK